MSSHSHPLTGLLGRYQPSGETEAANLQRIRDLVDATDDPWLRTIPLHVTASALVVHPPSGRVLLRWHQRQQAWLQVGGHGDPGEDDPLAIAMREAEEETGLTDLVPWPDAGIVHLAIVSVRASSKEPAHEHADIRFVFATATPDSIRAEKPDAPLRWLSVPAAEQMTERLTMRETLTRAGRLLAS